MGRRTFAVAAIALLLAGVPSTAQAQEPCRRAVIFTLPGVTWEMVADFGPPNILRLIDEGASGSMAVRTNSSRTTYASGFATIGAGTRTDGGVTAGSVAGGIPLEGPPAGVVHDAAAGGWPELTAAAEISDYVSDPGALADALQTPLIAVGNADLGLPPPTPLGYGAWTMLATSHGNGITTAAAVGDALVTTDPAAPFGVRTDPVAIEDAVNAFLEPGTACYSLVVDQGDLIRADTQGLFFNDPSDEIMRASLLAADELLGHIDSRLTDSDLLLVVSPTSPRYRTETHLGVAIAKGSGFVPGDTLQSASTRQRGIVTLPDVAPTVLEHMGIDRAAAMLGRSFVSVEASGDRLNEMVELDRESVFAHTTQAGISTAFVIFQIAIYAVAIAILSRRRRERANQPEWIGTWLRRAGLGIVAFPFSTYLATPLPAHRMGTALFVITLIAIDVAVVTVVSLLLKDPIERLLAITGSTIALFIIDLGLLRLLQLNAVWGNDPINAGRFTGLGNIAFAILGSSSLMTGALLVHRYPRQRAVIPAVTALFVVTVVVDGAPALGSDVGGVIALVPALGITVLLLLGRRPSWKAIVFAIVGTVAALGFFLLLDFARPPENRTHLARLVEDIRARGWDSFTEVASRKIRTNLRIFRSTIWTYLVPPALAVIAWLLLRPSGRWELLAERYPKLRAGLIGGLILAVIGFSVNDSGIVVPAMVLSFLAPMSLMIHLMLEREARPQGTRTEGAS